MRWELARRQTASDWSASSYNRELQKVASSHLKYKERSSNHHFTNKKVTFCHIVRKFAYLSFNFFKKVYTVSSSNFSQLDSTFDLFLEKKDLNDKLLSLERVLSLAYEISLSSPDWKVCIADLGMVRDASLGPQIITYIRLQVATESTESFQRTNASFVGWRLVWDLIAVADSAKRRLLHILVNTITNTRYWTFCRSDICNHSTL